MRRPRALLALGAAGLLLSGCAAAVVPVAAAGMIGKSKGKHRKPKRTRQAGTGASANGGYRILPIHELPPPSAAPAASATVPGSMQYLYGSGEAAALDLQAYMALGNYLIGIASDRDIGHDVKSVVLAPGATLDAPAFVPCGKKPLAIVFDIDETAVLNLGYEADAATTGIGYDATRWDAWERTGKGKVAAVPGVLDAVKVARLENIAVVFNSNRSLANADATAAMLADVGLGPVVHGDTLWLQGDAGTTDSGKDARRWAIAQKYCVVAMAGDQLGDFTDLFNAPGLSVTARREAVGGRHASVLWGRGWFLLPNSVYGTGLKGTMDEVFPLDKRWTGPALPGQGAP